MATTKKPKPAPVTSLADLKPRPAPTGRVRLGGAPSAPVAEPESESRTIKTTQRLYIVTKVTDVDTVHALVRAPTREAAIRAAGYERAQEVKENSLEGPTELVWDCAIQNLEDDDYIA